MRIGSTNPRSKSALRWLLRERILVLDGAMGTHDPGATSSARPTSAASASRDHPRELKGNNDLLSLTRPDVIRAIHDAYLDAGADIIETNTFNGDVDRAGRLRARGRSSTSMNVAAARMAREAADASTAQARRAAALRRRRHRPDQPHAVDLAARSTIRRSAPSPSTRCARAYAEQVRGLLDGGVDVLLAETIFDTLNLKACLFAIEEVFAERRAARCR